MIRVVIYKEADERDELLAEIRIQNVRALGYPKGDESDYNVKFAVERGMAVGLHTRTIYNFPRKKFNVLALVRQALATLEEKELELEDDFDPDEAPVSADMARRLRRALRQISGGER